jgi:hypothetical protein
LIENGKSALSLLLSCRHAEHWTIA